METKDIRWKQRFANFEKALMYLEEALGIKNPDIIQKAGIIQFFEMSYELAWNTIKDFLEEQGFTDVASPRAAIKKAFETGLITDGHSWMELILDRNLTAHAYDEEKVNQIEILIHGKYYPLLKAVYNTFKQKQHE
jgi:nucleotidyltransferase substrate binding protein (TIGR01987 family)